MTEGLLNEIPITVIKHSIMANSNSDDYHHSFSVSEIQPMLIKFSIIFYPLLTEPDTFCVLHGVTKMSDCEELK